jgi:hypothetical protein
MSFFAGRERSNNINSYFPSSLQVSCGGTVSRLRQMDHASTSLRNTLPPFSPSPIRNAITVLTEAPKGLLDDGWTWVMQIKDEMKGHKAFPLDDFRCTQSTFALKN